jgi:hypothetical protein
MKAHKQAEAERLTAVKEAVEATVKREKGKEPVDVALLKSVLRAYIIADPEDKLIWERGRVVMSRVASSLGASKIYTSACRYYTDLKKKCLPPTFVTAEEKRDLLLKGVEKLELKHLGNPNFRSTRNAEAQEVLHLANARDKLTAIPPKKLVKPEVLVLVHRVWKYLHKQGQIKLNSSSTAAVAQSAYEELIKYVGPTGIPWHLLAIPDTATAAVAAAAAATVVPDSPTHAFDTTPTPAPATAHAPSPASAPGPAPEPAPASAPEAAPAPAPEPAHAPTSAEETSDRAPRKRPSITPSNANQDYLRHNLNKRAALGP